MCFKQRMFCHRWRQQNALSRKICWWNFLPFAQSLSPYKATNEKPLKCILWILSFTPPISWNNATLHNIINGNQVCSLHYANRIVLNQLGTCKSYYKSSNICLFVPYLLRGPLTDLRQTWWVYVGRPRNCPWGLLFRKGQRVTFTFHYIIYAPASLHTLQRHLLLGKQQSLIRRLLLSCMSTTYVGGPGNCYWGVLFLKGQRVDGSTGRRVKRVNGSPSLSLYYIW